MNEQEKEQIENKIITKFENICADLNLNSEKNDWAKTYFFLKLIIKNINLYFNNPKNILNNLNINGSWGTGKSTIAYQVINNYEKKIYINNSVYYMCYNKNKNIIKNLNKYLFKCLCLNKFKNLNKYLLKCLCLNKFRSFVYVKGFILY